MRLLIVEDDEVLAQALQNVLTEKNYVVDVAQDGEEGWDFAQGFTYDLMLLDVSLPKLDGISLCRRLRDRDFRNPVLLLTARDSSADKVAGLDAGADDYVVKPCTIPELLARIRALLRRRSESGAPILQWGDLQFDPSTFVARWQETSLSLSPKELTLLELFLRNPQQVFTKGAILEHLWTFDDPPGEETIRAHIKGLRRKLKAAGATDVVETVYGVGYRLRELPTRPEAEPIAPPDELADRAVQTQAAIAQVWQQFEQPIRQRLTVMADAIADLEAGTLTAEMQTHAEQQAHKLVGSLGMYGWQSGSELARQMEALWANPHLGAAQAPQLHELWRALEQTLPAPNVAADQPDDRATTTVVPTTVSRVEVSRNANAPQVLLIDPDPAFAEALCQAAEPFRLQVDWVTTILAAQQRLAAVPPPALIALELALPETAPGSSIAYLQTLTQQYPQIPVIVLSHEVTLRDRVAVARSGGQQLLTKPLPPAQVLQVMTQCLRSRQTYTTKIMAVDDDAALLEQFQQELQPWDIHLQTLSDPRDFWQALQASQPDLLILDTEMPHIGGIELCQVVRSDPAWSNLPIVMIAENPHNETLQRAYEVGADDYLVKPIPEAELITRILNRLERTQLLKDLLEKDPLTGLANRYASERAFNRFIEGAKAEQQTFCFVLLEIQHLKQINVQYGHDLGDRILFSFGQRLPQLFSHEDIVARWSGGELIIGLYGLTPADAEQTLRRVLHQLEEEVFLLEDDTTLRLDFRGAIASYPEHGQTTHALYQRTHVALDGLRPEYPHGLVIVQPDTTPVGRY